MVEVDYLSIYQFLPDGSRASITLSGVDGLVGDVVYLRENLVRQYVDGRAIVWFAFGERELRAFPSSPPQWLEDVRRERADAWSMVFTGKDVAPPIASASGTLAATTKAGTTARGSSSARAKPAAPTANQKSSKGRATNGKQAGRRTS